MPVDLLGEGALRVAYGISDKAAARGEADNALVAGSIVRLPGVYFPMGARRKCHDAARCLLAHLDPWGGSP
jgi:hypothetical protein